MIPKIAHFHWTGPPMSWLRWCSIISFKLQNPDWEIRLHDTPPDIREYEMSYANEADWTWWRLLADHGGFQVATDIVFIRPVPEEWLQHPICCCKRGTNAVYQFAMLGAEPGHPFLRLCESTCESIVQPGHKGQFSYQKFGVDLLAAVASMRDTGPFFDQPMGALCPVESHHTPVLWNNADVDLPPCCIGVHWYGGHTMSKIMEWETSPSSDSYIARLAVRATNPATARLAERVESGSL